MRRFRRCRCTFLSQMVPSAYRFTEMLPPDVRAFVLERTPQTAVNAKAAALIYEGAHATVAQVVQSTPTARASLHSLDIQELRAQMSELMRLMGTKKKF